MATGLSVIADKLVAVLELENRALAAGDWARLRRLATHKRKAGRAYEEALAAGDPGSRPAAARRLMRAASLKVADAIEENERRRALLMLTKRRQSAAIDEGILFPAPAREHRRSAPALSLAGAFAAPLHAAA